MPKPGEGMMVLETKIADEELHDLIHLVAGIQRQMDKVEKILDKIVRDR